MKKSYDNPNKYYNVLILQKKLVLFFISSSILIYIFNWKMIFSNHSWFLKYPQAFSNIPSLLTMLCQYKNHNVVLFFLFSYFLSVINAFKHIKSNIALLPVWFLSYNLYNSSWNLQDGGNNLLLIYCTFLLFFFVMPEKYKKFKKFEYSFSHMCLLLMRFQLMLMYFTAAITKLQGKLWQNGSALFYILQNDYFSTVLARDLMMKFSFLSPLLSWMTIFFQISFPFMMFTKLRKIWMGAMLFFHLGIFMTMKLHWFALSMCGVIFIFLTEDEARKINSFISHFTTKIKNKFMEAIDGLIVKNKGTLNVNND